MCAWYGEKRNRAQNCKQINGMSACPHIPRPRMTGVDLFPCTYKPGTRIFLPRSGFFSHLITKTGLFDWNVETFQLHPLHSQNPQARRVCCFPLLSVPQSRFMTLRTWVLPIMGQAANTKTVFHYSGPHSKRFSH